MDDTIITTRPSKTEQSLSQECDRKYCTHQTPIPVTVEIENASVEWCPDCVREEFDVTSITPTPTESFTQRYVTVPAVVSFLIGSLSMLVVASIFVV